MIISFFFVLISPIIGQSKANIFIHPTHFFLYCVAYSGFNSESSSNTHHFSIIRCNFILGSTVYRNKKEIKSGNGKQLALDTFLISQDTNDGANASNSMDFLMPSQ